MHVFYDVHLGASHGTLGLILEEKLRKTALDRGEVAVFLNKSWTGVKLLTAGGNLLYWRSPYGRPITPEELRTLPLAFGGSRMTFTGNLESKLLNKSGEVVGKMMKKVKAVKAA